MANVNSPVGFKPAAGSPVYTPRKYPVAATQTFTIGDAVVLDSAGRLTIAAAGAAAVVGVAAEPCATLAADTQVLVWSNPMQEFEGQITTGALEDPYTCATAASCFDLAGTTGVQYIDAGASTDDLCKIIGVAKEPTTGVDSEVGAYQKKIFVFNKSKHQLGVQS